MIASVNECTYECINKLRKSLQCVVYLKKYYAAFTERVGWWVKGYQLYCILQTINLPVPVLRLCT
jgi:hypothetical protein